jgi:D-glycero-alpha-D-manno-heptose 1-phosphate guanylyltransferase
MLNTAIILAGGFGTRLKTIINDLPKPMAAVNGQPFLNYQLRYLKHFGFKKIILSVGYLAEKIRDYYHHDFEGLQIIYAIENAPLGTGGGIRLGLEKCDEAEALVLNGDSFFDVDLYSFSKQHERLGSQFSLALRAVKDTARYGTIETNASSQIVSFKEKTDHALPGLINAGMYILNKDLFLKNTLTNSNFSIEKDFFEKQLNNFTIMGFEFKGYFIDIGIPADYKQAQDDFKEFKY